MRDRSGRVIRGAAGVAGLFFVSRAGAVVPGQIDTFSDGTTDSWAGGGAGFVAGGGPGGASDSYLSVVATGGNGPTSKLVTYNRDQWVGDYTTAGVTSITVDLKDFSTDPLSIRLALRDSTSQAAAGYASTVALIVPADSAWHHATFAMTAAAMTPINSPAESFASLVGPGGNLAEVRFLDSASPALIGDSIVATLGIDNITAGSAAVPEPAGVTGVAAGALLFRRRRTPF